MTAGELSSGDRFSYVPGGMVFTAKHETELSPDVLTFGDLVSVIEWINPEWIVHLEGEEE
jgi:hypothetical protein